MSQEYVGALAIVILGILQYFKVEATSEQVISGITVIAGVWVMIRRYQKKDINILGVRK